MYVNKCLDLCECMCIQINMYLCMYVCLCGHYVNTRVYVCIYVCINVMYVYKNTCMCTDAHGSACTNVCAYMWRPEDNLRCHSSCAVCTLF